MSKDPTKINLQTNVSESRDPTKQRMSGYTRHKNMYFDVPFMSNIEDNLWQGGCQNGLILPHFIKHVVSLYPWEKYTVKHELDSYLQVKMYDSLDQATDQIEALAVWVDTCMKDAPTLVHCQAGLNRSSLVVGRALMLNDYTANTAIKMLRESRSPAVLCNASFEQYLLNSEPEDDDE